MWEVVIDGKTVLYTGDFSNESGSFIPAYQLPSRYLAPGNLDMLIMECTYGNTQFQSLDERRNLFINTILSTVKEGGKVLIPCYGIGYTQELLALLQEVWSEKHLSVHSHLCSLSADSGVLQLAGHVQHSPAVLSLLRVDHASAHNSLRPNQTVQNGLHGQ